MYLRQLLHECQSNAQAALGPSYRPIALHEEVEDVWEQLGRDADARIADLDDNLLLLLARDKPNPSPGLRILGGVCKQVHQDLLQPQWIGFEPQGSRSE